MSQQSFLRTTATGSDINFTITTFSSDEILVYVDGVKKTAGVHYNINPYNSNGQSTVDWIGTAPSSPSVIRVVRQTDVLNNGDTAVEGRATYQAGASVKADDLNNNQTQVLRSLQEHNDQLIQTYDLEDGSVNSAKIKDASIVEGDLANSAVTSNKIADNAVTTTEILNGAVTRAKLEADIIDGTKLADNAVDSEHYTDGSIDRVHLEADIIDSTKLADNAVNSEHYVDGSIDREHLSADIIDSTKLADNAVGAEHIQAGAITGTEISTGTLDSRYYTKAQSDAAYFNVSTGDTIKDGDTFPDNDTTIATTAAINDRIIDLVDDVGGFVPIANETSFPTSNPDVNNGAGTIVSVSAASTNLVPSGTTVTIANGRGTGNAVIITGVSATIPSGFGFLVETTSTEHTYAFHRLSPKATEVTTVAGKATEIGRLGTADAVADMAILGTADVVSDLNTLGTADVVSDMNTLATADVVADMNTLAVTSVVNNMDTVAGAVTNVNNVGGSIANVNTTAGSIANVNTVAGSIANVNTVGGAISNVNNVGGSISNVNTVASNINNVNSFFNTYRIGSNNPTTSLDTGDLFFNTTSNSLKVYTGSAWVDGVTTTGNFALKTGNTFTGSNLHNDNVKSIYGTGSDLQVYHDGSFARFQNTDGNILIKNTATSGVLYLQSAIIQMQPSGGGELIFDGRKDGNVKLYYDNSEKLRTEADGVQIFGSRLKLTDNVKAAFGSSLDLQIYHDGTNNYIEGNNQKTIIRNTSNNIHIQAKSGEAGIDVLPNSAVKLYHDGNQKFETTSTGVTVTGTVAATSYTGDGSNLTGINTDLVSDTSPQLGGNLDTNSFEISLDDSHCVNFGDGNDLKIQHSGNHAFIDNLTGNIYIRNDGSNDDSEIHIMARNDEESIVCHDDGSVELYYNGSKKLETTSSGVEVTGHLTVGTATLYNTGNFLLGDNDEIRFGAGEDLKIYHDGTDSVIKDAGTGSLVLLSNDLQILNAAQNEYMIRATENESVELYHDGSKKLETLSTGAKIFGDLFFDDGSTIKMGSATNGDLRIGHNGFNSTIRNLTGQLQLRSDTLTFENNNGSDFATVTGIKFGDNNRAYWGNGNDLQIYHDGSNSYVANTTGSLYILPKNGENGIQLVPDGAVRLYYDNSQKFQTTSNGSEISTGHLQFTNAGWTGEHAGKIQHHANFLYFQGGSSGFQFRSSSGSDRMVLDSSGHLRPASNNSYDLGTSSYRWRNVYTNDLHLSNEGHSNDVDGTWGNWTIQEGESDLFLKNNRSGKKYKFNLTEVS